MQKSIFIQFFEGLHNILRLPLCDLTDNLDYPIVGRFHIRPPPPRCKFAEFATYRIRAKRIYRTHSVYRAVLTRHIATYRTGDS